MQPMSRLTAVALLRIAVKNFVRGMAEIYSGPIIVGRDNMIFTP